MNRAPAVWATAVALALVNVGLAALIVEAIGVRSFAPVWLALVFVVLGLVATFVAVRLWRHYLADARNGSRERTRVRG
jgi:uncharacterized protein YjeT (DUF2065 family)